MKKNKIFLVGMFSLVLTLFLVGSACAFAISSAYWEGNPVKISPGESKEIYIVLQNLAGDSDLSFTGSITEGSEIAKIVDLEKEYFIPFGEKVKVNIKVKVPKEGVIGETNYVKIYFRTVPITGAQTLGMGSGIEKTIPILISEDAPSLSPIEDFGYWKIYLIVGILVVIIIVIIVIVRRKRNTIHNPVGNVNTPKPTNFK